MRGTDEVSGSLFSDVDLEARIPARHPLRKIRQVLNAALASLDGAFEAPCTDFGCASIAPERLIRASPIQILFPVRSGRQFAGADWIGLRISDSGIVRGVSISPLFVGLLGLALLFGALVAGWLGESGRKFKRSEG